MTDSRHTGRERFARELQLALSYAEIQEIYFDTVKDVLPADAVGYYRFLAKEVASPIEKSATLGESFMEKYEAHGRPDDPVLDFVIEHRLPGDSSRIATKRWKSSGAHSVLAAEGLVHSMEAPLTESGTVIGTINFARATDASGFAVEDLTSARFVAEHLSLAMERTRRFDALGDRASMLEGALQQSPQGVLIHDLDGTTLFTNRRAKEVLCPAGKGESRLRDLVGVTIAEFIDENRHVATVNVRDPSTGERVIVKSYKMFQKESVMSLVYDYPDEDDAALPVWGVLSPREQEIATMVSQGMTTRQIAAKAFVSENTVKQHLKRIFTKTDVHSRAELVQLIWSARQQSHPEPGRRRY